MFTRVIIRVSKNSSILSRLSNFSTVSPEPKNPGAHIDENLQIGKSNDIFKRNKIVEAAFASLQSKTQKKEIETPFTDSKIANAKNIEELLSVSEGNGVSRRHALKVNNYLNVEIRF